MRTLGVVWPAAALICLLILSGPTETRGRPLYAARTGFACARCHLDPAGGGIRTQTGFKYGLNGHTMVAEEEVQTPFHPRVGEGLRLGADLRAQYLQDARNELRDRSTFLLMQSSLYAAAELHPRVSLVYAHDLANTGRNVEAFALLGGFPASGTIKIGRFTPAFGLEEEDHTAFTRDPLGLGPLSQDTGIEFSLVRGRHSVSMSIVNGTAAAGLDDNSQKGLFLRSWSLIDRFGVGLSGYHNKPEGGNGAWRHRYIYGVFGHARFGRVAFLAEYDRGADEFSHSQDDSLRSSIRTDALLAELSCRLVPCCTVKLSYDRIDPDLEYAETARERVSLGMDSDLLPLVRFLAFTRGTREYGCEDNGCFGDAGARKYGRERDTVELLAQLHVFF